jgi:hypothetical protein
MQRALDRMTDAKDRGGWSEMIAATMRRIEATKDWGKLRGIKSALEMMVSREQSASRKRELQQLLTVLSSKTGMSYGRVGGDPPEVD